MDFQTLLNDKLVKTTQISAEDRVAEVRARSAGDGIALLDGMDAALVGTFRTQQGKVIAVYEEGRLRDIIKSRLRSEHPEASEDELTADAADLLSDLVRSFPYMGAAGAPLIIEGLV
ncbi:hypothetical protein [Fibrobacter sp.]|uniref:hypothetical protein n=1 Tax=Fibrobacter sp. TaxID=35828 RepID=UPI00388F8A7C